MRARLLLFLVSAYLSFLQGPSAHSTQLFCECSPDMHISIANYFGIKSTPNFILYFKVLFLKMAWDLGLNDASTLDKAGTHSSMGKREIKYIIYIYLDAQYINNLYALIQKFLYKFKTFFNFRKWYWLFWIFWIYTFEFITKQFFNCFLSLGRFFIIWEK